MTTTATTKPSHRLSEQSGQVGQPTRRPPPAIIVGVVLLLAGGVFMTVGWDKAAILDYPQGQFPYLLSASIPGLALVIIGMMVLVLAVVRRDAAEREEQIEKLNTSITELASMLGPKDPYDPAVTGEYKPRPRVASNGSDGDAATAEIPRTGAFEEGK